MVARLVIFDLDETLVYATKERLSTPYEFEVQPYFVYVRPFACALLQFAVENFNIAV